MEAISSSLASRELTQANLLQLLLLLLLLVVVLRRRRAPPQQTETPFKLAQAQSGRTVVSASCVSGHRRQNDVKGWIVRGHTITCEIIPLLDVDVDHVFSSVHRMHSLLAFYACNVVCFWDQINFRLISR